MQRKELTSERLAELLEYDPLSGVLRWRVSRGTRAAGSVAGSRKTDGYIDVQIDRRMYAAHRLAWLHVHGAFPVGDIDHINGDRADNRIANLRDVPTVINTENLKSAKSNNLSGYLGVSVHRRASGTCGYKAILYVQGEARYLGLFEDPESAHRAYLREKRKHHAGCTI